MSPAASPRRPGSGPRLPLDFELTSPVPFPTGADVVDACVRLRGVPVGVIHARASRGVTALCDSVADRLGRQLVTAIARQALGQRVDADPIAAAFEPGPHAVADAADVSVVLCTRDRGDDLDAALARLVASQQGEETIVVDHSEAGEAARIAAGYTSVRYLTESRPGLDHARNRGLAAASRPIVAFTDDDALVDAWWARGISAFFVRNPDASALTGLVLPLDLETEAQRRFEAYLGFGRGFAPHWHHAPEAGGESIAATHGNTGRLGTGANMAFRRAALNAVGGFHTGLDAGTRSGGGGDLEVLFRVLKAGGLIAYRPSIVVRHRHRRTLEALSEQIESWGTGMGAYLESVARSFPDEAEAVRGLRRSLLATWFARRWLTSHVLDRARHDLVRREVRGLRRGPSLLDPTAGDTRAFRRIHPPASPSPAAVAVVEIAEPIGPIEVPPGTAGARIFVRREGQPVGRMALDVVGGSIGADRLADEIAVRFGEAVLGMSGSAAMRRLRQVLHSMSRAA